MSDPAPHLTGTDVPELSTERLLLRPVTPDDLDPVHSYRSRPDVCRFLLHEPQTREKVAEGLAAYAERHALRADGDGVRWSSRSTLG